jgi:hypothetical protein
VNDLRLARAAFAAAIKRWPGAKITPRKRRDEEERDSMAVGSEQARAGGEPALEKVMAAPKMSFVSQRHLFATTLP